MSVQSSNSLSLLKKKHDNVGTFLALQSNKRTISNNPKIIVNPASDTQSVQPTKR